MGRDIQNLAELIKNSAGFYALTGAGVSTESGIPDFRSPGTGLWEKIDPIKNSTADVLREDPERFYRVGFGRFLKLKKAQPNRAHYALAALEKNGFLQGLVTQNIDGLHHQAGSQNIWEVHGHLRTCHCQECRNDHPWKTLSDQVEKDSIPPQCPECNGILRPNVVLFGDAMPSTFFDAEKSLRTSCDLLLVVGSSLEVYPVAGLVHHARKLAIINKQPTPYDQEADVVIQENCGEVLAELIQKLDIKDKGVNGYGHNR